MQPKKRSKRPLSDQERARREEQRRRELVSRDEIQRDYNFSKRWLELAALSGGGPSMIRISARMVRYKRGVFEDWLDARTVTSTSEEVSGS